MGNAYSFYAQTFLCGEPTWPVDQIPDMTGRIAIVTGGNCGIGKETVKQLLIHNAKVYMACRNEQKATMAINELLEITGKSAQFIQLDLADLRSVKAAAIEYTQKESQLHILINNAGVMYTPMDIVTKDGYDMQFGTNVLGPFYFTKLLLPTLLATVPHSPDGKVRVVNSTSSAHYIGAFDFATFKDGYARRARLIPETLYGQSKFGVVVFAKELARQYGDQGIISTSVNPGHVKSDLTRYISSDIKAAIVRYLQFYPVSYGALGQLYAATTKEGLDLNGKFLKPWATVGAPRPASQDPQLGKDLWDWLEAQVAFFEESKLW